DEPGPATAVGGGGAKMVNPSQTTIKNQPAATDTVRPLTHDAPLRLWVGGDSLAGSFGPALGDLVGATGVAKTTVDYKVSSGLWGSDFRDWPSRATEQMAAHNPEAVVFMIGANDTPAVNMVDNDADGTPDWQVEYRAKISEMMKTFVGPNHRTVYWIGPPTLGTDSMDEGALALSDIMRREAEKFAPVVFVDAYQLFSVESGEYSRVILDENGEEFTARIADGVHLSADGAEFLGRTLFSLLDAQWKLTKQADAAQPIGWSFADGSGENIPGYSSPPRRYQSNSGSSNNGGGYTPEPTYSPVTEAPVAATLPPATSPPATSPPATSPPPPPPTTPATSPPPQPTTP
ncbi:MAG TPA: DUF459 domain-containing protein, partial [Acidimicrobiia bacterium]|nr:DUF459 domain-containing protein [Acidimicrobiia bacterium]